LTDKLNEMGIEEKEANVRNKIGRGKFSAAFMAECMDAIGATARYCPLLPDTGGKG